jgi:predicted PurR-regulated permease PerM
MLRGSGAAAATLFVLLALAMLLLPTVLLGASLVDAARELSEAIDGGALRIPPPPDSVASWPLIGESVHRFWSTAALNLGSALAAIGPELAAFFKQVLSTLVGTGLGVLQFAASLVIAGVMLAQSERAPEAARALGERLAGPRGRELVDLAGATVRGVAKGVLGVAAIQAALAAIGFMLMGIPGAGLWALLVLLLCVIQIGPALVMLPIAIYVFSITGTLTAVVYLVWSIAVILLDNVLKPILIGRGVNVPTMVIFVGAIGGFLSSGIIGLFVGAVVLSIAYELFTGWLHTAARA